MIETTLIASITLNVIAAACLLIKIKRKQLKNKSRKKPENKISSNSRTISCPSCSQQIRFTIPLNGNKAKCRRCSAQFKLDIDSRGNVYITEIKIPEDKNAISSLDECYTILDIKPDSIPIDIKAAYKKKISEYHPDKVEILGVKIKQAAEEEVRRINAAYTMLQKHDRV